MAGGGRKCASLQFEYLFWQSLAYPWVLVVITNAVISVRTFFSTDVYKEKWWGWVRERESALSSFYLPGIACSAKASDS